MGQYLTVYGWSGDVSSRIQDGQNDGGSAEVSTEASQPRAIPYCTVQCSTVQYSKVRTGTRDTSRPLSRYTPAPRWIYILRVVILPRSAVLYVRTVQHVQSTRCADCFATANFFPPLAWRRILERCWFIPLYNSSWLCLYNLMRATS